MLTRRRFILGSAGLSLLRTPSFSHGAAANDYVFTLGVGSGCPRADRVVLWTRLAPSPLAGGGMGLGDEQVRVRVCRDPGMTDAIIDALALAPADEGHSVHFHALGLEPGREYWYQFYIGDQVSPIGRTRTAPGSISSEPVRIALASCQAYETGYYAAYRDMAEQLPDLVVHVGDYIYEGGAGGPERLRQHRGPEIQTLWDYRNRWAQYKMDPQLQAAHAASPWLFSPDDHEIDNNWAGYTPQDPERQTDLEFRVRRWSALRALYEHAPLEHRPTLSTVDSRLHSTLRLFDSFDFGRQLRLVLLDTRQYRSDQVCSQAFPSAPHCEARLDPGITMTGAKQEQFLATQLATSSARWNVMAQQVWFNRYRYPDNEYNMDQWDGYASQQARLHSRLTDPRLSNPVVLSGDWHIGCASDIPRDLADPQSPAGAVELAATSISSNCPWAGAVEAALPDNPQVRYLSGNRRGYVLMDFDDTALRSQYRLVDDPTRADSAVSADIELMVEAGRRGFAG